MIYTANEITTLSGLDAIRKRPGMYIGSDGLVGLHHLLKEAISNSLDEAMAGYGDIIRITIDLNGAVTVEDEGRGIPVEWKADNNMSALTAVLTSFHTGGKFSESGYAGKSGGINGIGGKAINALSTWVNVEVRRYGLIFRQSFHNGGEYDKGVLVFNPNSDNKPVAEITAETTFDIAKNGLVAAVMQDSKKKVTVKPDAKLGTGTKISFLPHREWFDADNMNWEDSVPWNYNQVATLCQQLAYLNPAITIELTDHRKSKTVSYHYPKGLVEYTTMLNDGLEPAHEVLSFTHKEGPYEIEIALQYTTDGDESQIYSFVNSIPTHNGGTHVSGFQSGLTKAMNSLGNTKDKIRGDDLLLGLAAVIKLNMNGTPQFSSQTKDTLTTPEVQGVVMSATYAELTNLLKKHKSAVRIILKQAQASAKGREVAKKARQLTIRKSVLDAPDDAGILSKLADTDKNTPPEDRILFLVEGDSAGGTCCMARDRKIHAILASRGKIINASKKDMARVLQNNEIKAFVAALGAGFGVEFSSEDRRYGKIAIFSDADVDGLHIRSLWLAFFYTYMRPLLERGYVYIAEAPLYRVYDSKQEIYCYSDKERVNALAQIGSNAQVQRFKGLGEMSAEQMRATTLAVGKERLIQVQIDDIHKATKAIHLLMADNNAAGRKEWLLSNWGNQ